MATYILFNLQLPLNKDLLNGITESQIKGNEL